MNAKTTVANKAPSIKTLDEVKARNTEDVFINTFLLQSLERHVSIKTARGILNRNTEDQCSIDNAKNYFLDSSDL